MRNASLILAGSLAVVPFIVNAAESPDRADVIAIVKQYDDAFNKSDMKAWNALCVDQAIIIDDFAPHVWQGANTCGTWWDAFVAEGKKENFTEANVQLNKPLHLAVTGDRAYIVEPTVITYKLKGKPMRENGVWTLTLQKLAEGWRITGWAGAQH